MQIQHTYAKHPKPNVGLESCIMSFAYRASNSSYLYMQMQSNSAEWLINGLIFGQETILTVSAGLWGRFWLAGIWRSTLLSFIVILIVLGFMDSSELLSTAVVVFVTPIAVMCVASPLLLAMRYFCDWRLVPRETPHLTSPRAGTSDFMLAITSVAALIFLTKVPQVAWELNTWSFGYKAIMPMLFLFLLSFLTTVPTVWFYFPMPKENSFVGAVPSYGTWVLLQSYSV